MIQPTIIWPVPASFPVLQADDVDVWLADLQVLPAVVDAMWELLHEDERTRARRFHFEKDYRKFVVCRGTLRTLLGAYTGVSTAAIRFKCNSYGKPSLEWPADSNLEFNISHSGTLAIFAFAAGRSVGADIEIMRPEFSGMEIAKRFFSENELSALRNVESSRQHEAFFNCWSRKEAFIKAKGLGLSLPLHSFDVSLKPGEPAGLLATRDPASDLETWTMYDLPPVAGYASALVVQGRGAQPHHWQWQYE